MRLTIESTPDLGCIELEDGAEVPCRVWKGTTERGTQCLVFVTRIAVPDEVLLTDEFAELSDKSDSTNVKWTDTRQ